MSKLPSCAWCTIQTLDIKVRWTYGPRLCVPCGEAGKLPEAIKGALARAVAQGKVTLLKLLAKTECNMCGRDNQPVRGQYGTWLHQYDNLKGVNASGLKCRAPKYQDLIHSLNAPKEGSS